MTLRLLPALSLFAACSLINLLGANAIAGVSIEELAKHTFPDAVQSTNGRARIVLDAKGVLGGATTATLIGSDYHSGEYLLRSDSNETFSVNIYSNNDVRGVKLSQFSFRYRNKTYTQFPVRGLKSPGKHKVATIGMKVAFTQDLGPGDYYPSFVIDIEEERDCNGHGHGKHSHPSDQGKGHGQGKGKGHSSHGNGHGHGHHNHNHHDHPNHGCHPH